MINKLSVVIPAYNEETTITEILRRISVVALAPGIEREIIVVDDCSTDQTRDRVELFRREHQHLSLRYFRHDTNRGKGAAIQTAISHVSGDYLIIQDADLEYDPEDYTRLIEPVLKGDADIVYGTRFRGANPHRILFFWHTIGNRFLTSLSNMVTNLNLTDMESGYKLLRVDLLKGIKLKEKRFGFEPEITAKISRIPNIKIFEVGISYYGRTYHEGKKIKWQDGFRAIYCILKYGLFSK